MSHFPVLVIVKKDEVEVNVLSELERIEYGGKEQYVNQYKSDKVEELLNPYTEVPNSEEDLENFFEFDLEEDEDDDYEYDDEWEREDRRVKINALNETDAKYCAEHHLYGGIFRVKSIKRLK